jgi:hypothetical protein
MSYIRSYRYSILLDYPDLLKHALASGAVPESLCRPDCSPSLCYSYLAGIAFARSDLDYAHRLVEKAFKAAENLSSDNAAAKSTQSAERTVV